MGVAGSPSDRRQLGRRRRSSSALRHPLKCPGSQLFDEGRRRPRQGTRRKIVVVLVHTLAQSSSVVRCEHGRRSPSTRRGSKRPAMFFDRGRTNVPADRLHNRTMSIAVRTRLPWSKTANISYSPLPSVFLPPTQTVMHCSPRTRATSTTKAASSMRTMHRKQRLL